MRNNQFMERLFTIIMTGAYGLVMVWMFASHYFGWNPGQRSIVSLVTNWIQYTIAIAGVFLVLLSLIMLWNIKSKSDGHHHDHDPEDHDHDCCDHDHDHSHDHEHKHDHAHDKHQHHDHSHGGHDCCDHDHEHGWNPIRYIPLLIPLILIVMGLPDSRMIESFERYRIDSALKDKKFEQAPNEHLCWMMLGTYSFPGEVLPQVAFTTSIISGLQGMIDELDDDAVGVKPVVTDLAQLDKVVMDPALMQQFEHYRKVEIDGMFNLEETGPLTVFRVVRLRMACCLTDSRPAMIYCATKKKLPDELLKDKGKAGRQWVRVQGKLKFARTPEGKVQALLKAVSVELTPTPPFPYLN